MMKPNGAKKISTRKPTKNAGLWVVALASVVVAAALVVIALMSVQTRDAEREQACWAKWTARATAVQASQGVYSRDLITDIVIEMNKDCGREDN